MSPLILAATLALIAANDAPQTAVSQTAAPQSAGSSTAASPPQAPPAQAAQAAKPAKGAKPAKPPVDPDKEVCRDEPLTGSRFTRHVCMTQGQWDEAEKGSRQMMNFLDSQAGRTGGVGGTPP